MSLSRTHIRILSAALGLALLLVAAGLACAQDAASGTSPARVVMFTSGVGFFEHQADVDGDAQFEMKFNVKDINDLLKSMVAVDLDGGRISTVSYGSKDPITKTLKTFAIDLTTNPTLAQLLDQVRGEQVEVATSQATSGTVRGTILGIEHRTEARGETTVSVDFLNLLTEEGLESVSFDRIARVKLLNEALDAELRRALVVLATGHDVDRKSVVLNLEGTGKRRVRVGYIQQTPLWKTTYRLVLGDDQKPYLQGWAIVENTTETDWRNVQLTLVSGRPISFMMDLYEPLYVPRPLVEPELYASLRPPTYQQNLLQERMNEVASDAQAAGKMVQRMGRGRQAEAAEEGQSMFSRALGLAAAPAPSASYAAGGGMGGYDGGGGAGFESYDYRQGVESLATASDVGEAFQYAIARPVDLARQQSALLPIAGTEVEAEKVSIYNVAVHAKHPLAGLRLTNTTELHLMQGPITVFDSGVYAGDARIEDLPPGGERLLSYAMDLDTEVAPRDKPGTSELVNLRLTKGVAYTEHKHSREQEYTVKNSGKREKTVLIEHARNADWKLITPEKPDETTRDAYRFAVAVEAGKTEVLPVREEYTTHESVSINNLDDNTIQYYVSGKNVSDAVKKSLTEIVRRKREIEAVVRRRNAFNEELGAITQDQSRVRDNMGRIDRNSDLYRRYIAKFTEQEDRIEKLHEEIIKANEEETALRKALDDYLLSLDVA